MTKHVLLEQSRLIHNFDDLVDICRKGSIFIDDILKILRIEGSFKKEVVVHDEGVGLSELIDRFNAVFHDNFVLLIHDLGVDDAMDVDHQIHGDVENIAELERSTRDWQPNLGENSSCKVPSNPH
jgi:hypothetical protein